MEKKVQEKLDEIIDEFTSSKDFIDMISLEKEIEEKYGQELEEFNLLKEEYQRALQMKKYYPDFQSLETKLSDLKNKLFQEDLIKAYLALQRKNQDELTKLSNEIAKGISNKFIEKKIFK